MRHGGGIHFEGHGEGAVVPCTDDGVLTAPVAKILPASETEPWSCTEAAAT